MLTVVVHSHRHNKNDEFIAETKMDFSIVRDTMYKYSKKSQEKFFSYPIFAFLFVWFAQSQEGHKFIYSKFHKKGGEYLKKMKGELEDLKTHAVGHLRKAATFGGDQKHALLLTLVQQQ